VHLFEHQGNTGVDVPLVGSAEADRWAMAVSVFVDFASMWALACRFFHSLCHCSPGPSQSSNVYIHAQFNEVEPIVAKPMNGENSFSQILLLGNA
jgi:hypothetical protein